MGDDYFAVPMQALTFSEQDEDLIKMDVDKQTLKNAPGFNKDNWPSTSSNDFTDSVYEHYGYERKAYKPLLAFYRRKMGYTIRH